ncbi:MAG: hypothetical protein OXH52_17635 [Gammaproteobacteria bacterium]|nr:hypothetical protein [Gammaproteobacteria bacterium]
MREHARRDEEEDTKIKLAPMLDMVFIMLQTTVHVIDSARRAGVTDVSPAAGD